MTASRPRQVSAGRVPWGTRICISWTPGPQAHAWNTMSRVPDSGESQATLLRSLSCGNRNYAERNSWEICTFVYNEAFRCVVTVSGPASPTFPITPASMTQSELHPSPPRAPAPAFRPGHWRRRTVLAWYCLRVRTHLCLKPAPLLNSQPPSSHLPALPTYAGSFQFYASLRFPPPRLEL